MIDMKRAVDFPCTQDIYILDENIILVKIYIFTNCVGLEGGNVTW